VKRLLIPLFVSALFLSAACGDDDGGSDNATSGDAPADQTGDETDDNGDSGGGGDTDKFCETIKELDAAEDPTESLDENATPEDIENAIRDQFAEFGDEIDDLRSSAPDEISDDVDIVADAIESFVDGDGSLDDIGTPEVTAASDRLDTFEQENCGEDADGEGQ
jgi:hypothetical protein